MKLKNTTSMSMSKWKRTESHIKKKRQHQTPKEKDVWWGEVRGSLKYESEDF